MEKNYYELLEVDHNASDEMIEKAFKLLAKKYHPDLQEEKNKEKSAEIFKQINEAYQILSDETKRKIYNETISVNTISREDFNALKKENDFLKHELNNHSNFNSEVVNNNTNQNHENYESENERIYYNKMNDQYYQEIQLAKEKAYHDAYIQDLKNRGYKIKYKKSFSFYFKNFLALFITIIILIIIIQIPFIKNLLMSNIFFKALFNSFN